MEIPNHFISGDWGTSNFRLRLVETETLKVLAEVKNDQGVKTVYQKYLNQNKISQYDFFLNFLLEQTLKLTDTPQEYMIILAGMASANIGLLELDYANLPILQNGSSLKWEYLSGNSKAKILLISGVRGDTGMMRGEEIQAVGLEEYLAPFEKGILLLPGTHSKHLAYSNRKFSGLKNFMTGELFEIFSKHSILANSIATAQWDKKRETAFKEGLVLGFDGKLNENLFSVRAKDILYSFDKQDNYYFLSGLLIGDELSYLKEKEDKIFLAASGTIYEIYREALQMLFATQRLVLFNKNMLEKAFLQGQKKILYQYGK
ncbi:2-dehydro-3-deoxygalactonokinase [Chondrinema litorale]|uniref:2-dehydro-3-deoxygalactonokinase n=1 Tax=Chondrinema litorale TaxID=2994555 RepID=UPI002542F3B9|nr:2-dehydro-3-deoxygalactonokinase [Chondrinema litorale]UZR96407.1 2-dehydro-3-deoxygalactonokinase [Chondrinema litorale]